MITARAAMRLMMFAPGKHGATNKQLKSAKLQTLFDVITVSY
jgi:hypothetical protein